MELSKTKEQIEEEKQAALKVYNHEKMNNFTILTIYVGAERPIFH